MENITEILSALGISVPDDKAAELTQRVAQNYKTVAEFEKKVNKATEEAEDLKKQLKTAKDTLASFDAENIDGIKQQLADYKQKAEDAEKEYAKRIEERDFADALKSALDGVKFTSSAAREAVTAKVKGAGLKLVDGKILGLNDLLSNIKEADKTAFADDDGGDPPAKFTQKMAGGGNGKKYKSREEIMAIKDATERQKAIASNMEFFRKGE